MLVLRRVAAVGESILRQAERRTSMTDEETLSGTRRRNRVAKAFSAEEARRLLDAPDPTTLEGLRDRAMLAVGLQVGLRRNEICRLRVRALLPRTGHYADVRSHVEGTVATITAAAGQVHAYLKTAGHGSDFAGPLFRAVRASVRARGPRRGVHTRTLDVVVKKHGRLVSILGRTAHGACG
jgi:integrase